MSSMSNDPRVTTQQDSSPLKEGFVFNRRMQALASNGSATRFNLKVGHVLMNQDGKSAPPRFQRNPRLHLWQGDLSHVEKEIFSFPHVEAPKIIHSLKEVPNLKSWNIPKISDTIFSSELFRLKETALWWESTFPTRVMSAKCLMIRCLSEGPSFAEWLDEGIKYSFRLTCGKAFLTEPREFPEQSDFVWGFDYFFSPYHLIHWEIPPGDDYKLVFQDPPEIEASLITSLKKVMKQYIKVTDQLPQLDDLDRLKLQTGTKMLTSRGTREFNFQARGKKGTPLTLTDTFLYERCFVNKAPHEGRDAFVPDEKTRNSLLLIHKQCGLILDHPADYITEKSFEKFADYLTGRSTTYYVMSDQKKCGLTFPLPLIKAFIEVLNELYPKEDLSHFQGYLNAWLKTDGQSLPSRIRNGVGLGMANEIISFIVACVYQTWKDSNGWELDAAFYNDDQVIRYHHDEDDMWLPETNLEDILESWNMHMASYGMAIHKKKPFVATSGVFLEIYGRAFGKFSTDKVTQYVGCLFQSLTCCNITAAKEFVAGVWDSIPATYRHYAEKALNKVISLWGYEFTPCEINQPFELGGWIRTYRGSWNDLLRVASNLEGQEQRFISLLRVKKPYKADPRSVKFTDPGKYESILNLGYSDDPTVFAWRTMAGGALGPSYVRPKGISVKKIYDNFYEKRKEAFWAPTPNINELICEFYNNTQGESKYIPPKKYCCEPLGSQFVAPQMRVFPVPVDKMRSWYKLLEHHQLSSVKIDSPAAADYEDYLRNCFAPPQLDDGEEYAIEEACASLLLNVSLNDLRELRSITGGLIPNPWLAPNLVNLLRLIIPGKGKYLIWEPVTGLPMWSNYLCVEQDILSSQTVSDFIQVEWNTDKDYERLCKDDITAILEVFEQTTKNRNSRKALRSSGDNPDDLVVPDEMAEDIKYIRAMFESVGNHAVEQLDYPDRQESLNDYLNPDSSNVPNWDSDDDLPFDLF
jgi:hypothetical protein